MKINYFRKGGTQYDLNRLYVINSAQASGNYDDLRKMIEGDGNLYNLNAKQRYISNGGTEAGFDRMNQLADEVYANFIKNNPIDTSFLKPIQRQQAVVKPATDWNKVAQDYNFANTSAVQRFQKWVNDTYGPNTLVVDGKIGNMTKGALEKYGQEYYNYLNPVETEQEKAYALKMLGLNTTVNNTPAPLQTQPSVTTASMPIYDANGNPTGEQKTMYFGRGQQPRQQATVAPAPAQPQTTTSATQQTATLQQSVWRPGMPYPSLPKFEGPTLWDDVKNVASGITSATAKVRNALRQSGYSAGNYTSSRNPGLQGVVDIYHLPEWQPSTTHSEIADRYRKANGFKYGGSINYFQQGGQMQDPVGQVIQGLLQDPQGTMQALSQMQGQQGGKEQVNAILQEIVKRAKGGDQQAIQAVQVLQQVMQGGQQTAPQQAPAAKNGAKLNYLKQLKGKCPEGEELVYMKKGGFVCPVCQKKKLEEGAKVNKTEFFKKDTKKPLDKCGGKMKAKKK